MPPRLALAIAACFTAAQAVLVLLAPERLAQFVGFDLTTWLARSEFATVFGGLYLGMATFFLIALWRRGLREGALAFIALGAGGALLVRLATVLTMPIGILDVLPMLVLEMAFTGLGVLGWRGHRRAAAGEVA